MEGTEVVHRDGRGQHQAGRFVDQVIVGPGHHSRG